MLAGLAAVWALLACRTRGPAPDGEVEGGPRSKANKKMQYTATDLGFGFKSPTNTPPSIELLRDDTAYQAAAERDSFAYRFDDEKVPPVDFQRYVVVLLERDDDGGTDIRPVVKDIVRTDDSITFETGFEMLPNPQNLDVVRRPYLYFTVPKEAFDGDPRVQLVVDGRKV